MTALPPTNTADPVPTNSTGVELVHAGPLSADAARQAMATYQEISTALISADDLQTIQTRQGSRSFPKRSAFQKLANAYRVSTEIKERVVVHDHDDRIIRCDAIVRATHPDGRFSEGDGTCSRTEDRFARNDDKIDHDLPATAVTRATNRAISNLIAFGAVSAEEASADSVAPAATVPAWAEHIGPDRIAEVGTEMAMLLAAASDGDGSRYAEVGQQIFDACDEGIPDCVARAIHAFVTVAGLTDELKPEQDGGQA